MNKFDQAGQLIVNRYPIFGTLFVERGRETMLAVAGLLLTAYLATFGYSVISAKDLITFADAILGGDFIIFWVAAKAVFTDGAAALYDNLVLENALREAAPARDQFLVSWQYPPTMFFMVAPFAALPFLPAYGAWLVVHSALFAGALSQLWRNGTAIFVAFASAATLQAWITGQTGFLTAALLAMAAAMPTRRPILAGIAAGLLTIKPQFGLLIPLAFAAAGCWRAFSVAAITAIALAGASVMIFGVEAWIAFFEAVQTHGGRLQSDVFPFNKVISPYGGLMMLGTPTNIAMGVHVLCAVCLAAFVFLVWRKVEAWDLRAMILCTAAALATPYAFYYELPIFIPPLLLLAHRGVRDGWLRGERFALAILWVLPVYLPGSGDIPGVPLAFLAAFSAFLLCVRRVIHETHVSSVFGGRAASQAA